LIVKGLNIIDRKLHSMEQKKIRLINTCDLFHSCSARTKEGVQLAFEELVEKVTL